LAVNRWRPRTAGVGAFLRFTTPGGATLKRVHWHFCSSVPGDVRVQLAAAMAAVMAPLGVTVSASTVGPVRPEVAESLGAVGLRAAELDALGGRAVDVLVVLEDDAVPSHTPAAQRHVLRVPPPPSLDDLGATRERLREHLRRLMARRADRPADPEANVGWIRDVDRQED
jgi:hypothetical protein